MQKLRLQAELMMSARNSTAALAYAEGPYGIQLKAPTDSAQKGEESLSCTKRTDPLSSLHTLRIYENLQDVFPLMMKIFRCRQAGLQPREYSELRFPWLLS